MLTALLPLLESLAGESGLLGGLGSSAGGGLGAMAGRLGFAKSFGSQAEMGQALQKMSDLGELVKQTQASIDANKQKQAQHAETFRQDEKLYGYGNPADQAAQAKIAQQNLALSQQLSAHQQQLSGLSSRLSATQNPVGASFRRAGTILAGVQAAQTFGPGLLRQFPGVQAAQNIGGFLAGPTNSAIAGQMAGTAGSLLTSPFTGAAKGAAIGGIAGPAGAAVGAVVGGLVGTATEISKLPQKLQQWGQALVDSKSHLAQFSPAVAYAMSQSQSRQFQRNFASGRETGGNIAELSNRLQNLYDVVRPASDQITNVLANILSGGVTKVTELVVAVRSIHAAMLSIPVIGNRLRTIENILAAKSGSGPTEMPFATFLNNAQRSAADRFRSRD